MHIACMKGLKHTACVDNWTLLISLMVIWSCQLLHKTKCVLVKPVMSQDISTLLQMPGMPAGMYGMPAVPMPQQQGMMMAGAAGGYMYNPPQQQQQQFQQVCGQQGWGQLHLINSIYIQFNLVKSNTINFFHIPAQIFQFQFNSNSVQFQINSMGVFPTQTHGIIVICNCNRNFCL